MIVERLAPTLRPPGIPVQRQTWLRLLFLHWKVPVAQLRPLIPAELEIDTFAGEAYVGLVPFTMRGVRPVWAPAVPAISDFHETNVRTYVHYRGQDPGVWFFSLDAANALAAWIARTFWHLPYHHARMELSRGRDGTIRYATERCGSPHLATCSVHYRPCGTPQAARLGTLEHFLAERYVLYAQAGRGLQMGRVHHAPYPLQPAEVLSLDETMLAAAGIARGDEPPLAHYAAGVEVEVFRLAALPSPPAAGARS